MEKFDSITHFIQSGSFEYRIFDMGRKIFLMSNEGFEKLENQQEVYPYPFQKKAWLALLIWAKGKESEATIWFLQFPIDELGFIKQESRDAFLIELLEQAAKNIQAKQKGGKVLDELGESPFAFKPAEDRLAIFHAFAIKELAQKPSHYYQATREYLKGNLGYEQWQFLGLQGIADVVVRLEEDENEGLLVKAFAELPDVPLERFALLLENVSPNKALTQTLRTLLRKQIESETPNISLASALVRALSGVKPDELRMASLTDVLEKSASSSNSKNQLYNNIEILVAVSGRAWQDLHDSNLLNTFLENLATQNQMAFNAVLTDLMMLPNMKQKVMDAMRRDGRSDALSKKITVFMKVLQGK